MKRVPGITEPSDLHTPRRQSIDRWRRGWLYALGFLLLILLLAFVFRSPLAGYYLQKKIRKFNKTHHAELVVDKLHLRGIASVEICGITLKPEGGDTLLKLDTVYASLDILKLLTGRLVTEELDLRNLRITMERRDTATNYMFLLGEQSKVSKPDSADSLKTIPPATSIQPADFSLTADRMGRFLFDRIPHSLRISGFDLSNHADGHRVHFHLDQFNIRDHFFHTTVLAEEDSTRTAWVVTGKLDNPNRDLAFRLYAAKGGPISIPYIDFRWQARVKFDTLSFSLAEQPAENGRTTIRGYAAIRGLTVDHEKIAAQPVTFDKLAINYNLLIGEDYAELDSSTTITFNRIDLHPYVKYRPYPTKQITLHISKPEFPARDLFASLPPALFTTLQGITVNGNLSWFLDFEVDLSQPDSLKFATDLVRHQFTVTSYGSSNLTRINDPFEYTAYEQGVPVSTFMVGPENPDFRPIDRISPYLRSAVLTSEDGSFYLHRGFLADAFRESIITNIKERRFARGGSTISMQLVKNVFLNRNKTIARKLEEALIVWLIENQGLSTKDRMFEVYLNIIEWGPRVYGANAAAHFYFNKDAARLTLAESIFLASIIPRPKWFMYTFDKERHLTESNAGFYRLVSEKMLNKGWITPQDAARLIPDVELKGPAKELLKKSQ